MPNCSLLRCRTLVEDQMTNFTSDIDRAAAGYSPGPR
jgi:hypothetical protein